MTHSTGFFKARSKILWLSGEYNCLANCWVMVLPPPALFWPIRMRLITARPMAFTSMPECSSKRESSVAISASVKWGDISSKST